MSVGRPSDRALKFLGKAMAGLVLTPEAQKAISYKIAELTAPPRPSQSKQGTPPARQSARAAVDPVRTATRAELLRQAKAIYAAKQTVLAALDAESREKLAALAATLFGGQTGAGARPAAARPAAGARRSAPSRNPPARPMSPQRAELLRRAMEIRSKGKEAMLSGLDDDRRAELLCMAILTFAGAAG